MTTNTRSPAGRLLVTAIRLGQAGLLTLALVTSTCAPKAGGGDGSSIDSSGGRANTASGGAPAMTSSGGAIASSSGGAVLIDPGAVNSAGNAGASQTQCVTSCNPVGGQWCGEVGNACGGKLQCPACPGDWTCQEGICVGGPSCTPFSCVSGDTHYCGDIGDGCGGVLHCGDCAGGTACGGGGLANVCPVPNCTPKTCVDAMSNGHYCGDIGDGCGGVLHCGDCPNGKACGGDGVPNVCEGATQCTNLQCRVIQDDCPSGSPTTLTGTVYDPAGKLPLYNALVYIPNDPLPLPAIPDGATCDACAAFAAGSPLVAALTDVAGKFTLSGVPSGANVPLVIQVGKWRREVTLDTTVNKCTSNAIMNRDLTRLPRNKSEGHIPRIAVTTGGQDAMECLLRRIGIDDKEFTTDSGDGRVHMYVGGRPPTSTDGGQGGQSGAGGRTGGGLPPTGGFGLQTQGTDQFASQLGGQKFPLATTLWSDPMKLQSHDILIMSCEGDELGDVKQPYLGNMLNYMNGGGRVFASHFHYYWMRSGAPELQGTAKYEGRLADPPSPMTGNIDTSFPKGAALADWLMLTGGSTTRGQISIYTGRHSVSDVVPPTLRWIWVDHNPNDRDGMRQSVQYMTFNTPVTAAPENQCGRVVFSDIHLSGVPAGTQADRSVPGTEGAFPQGCTTSDATPQAKALEFLLFDLSACVTPGEIPPPIPAPPGVPPPASAAPPPPPPPPPPPK